MWRGVSETCLSYNFFSRNWSYLVAVQFVLSIGITPETAINYGSWPRQCPRRKGDQSNKHMKKMTKFLIKKLLQSKIWFIVLTLHLFDVVLLRIRVLILLHRPHVPFYSHTTCFCHSRYELKSSNKLLAIAKSATSPINICWTLLACLSI
jgi:hypothetical protein